MYSYISQKASGAQAKLFKMLNLNILNYWNVSKHLKMLSSCSFFNKWQRNTDLFGSFSSNFCLKNVLSPLTPDRREQEVNSQSPGSYTQVFFLYWVKLFHLGLIKPSYRKSCSLFSFLYTALDPSAFWMKSCLTQMKVTLLLITQTRL